jgi:hypothetical protein
MENTTSPSNIADYALLISKTFEKGNSTQEIFRVDFSTRYIFIMVTLQTYIKSSLPPSMYNRV